MRRLMPGASLGAFNVRQEPSAMRRYVVLENGLVVRHGIHTRVPPGAKLVEAESAEGARLDAAAGPAPIETHSREASAPSLALRKAADQVRDCLEAALNGARGKSVRLNRERLAEAYAAADFVATHLSDTR